MLAALFGYTSTPEVTTFVVWLTYVVVVLTLFLRPVKRSRPPAPAPAPTPAPRPTSARLGLIPDQNGRIAPRSGSAPSRPNRKIVPTNRLNRPATAPIAT